MASTVGFVRATRGGPSPSDQKDAIRAYAQHRDWTVDTWCEGPEGEAELLEGLDNGSLERVIVAQLDLMVPSIERLRRVIAWLERDGVQFISVAEELSLPGPHGRLLAGVLRACGRMEWLQLCDHLRAGLEYRHKVSTRGPETKHYGLRPGEELVIEHIRRLAMDGHSQQRIASSLTRDGAPPRRGGRWCRKMVGKLLKRVTLVHPHRPIVSRAAPTPSG